MESAAPSLPKTISKQPDRYPHVSCTFDGRCGWGAAGRALPDLRRECGPQRTLAARPLTGGCRPGRDYTGQSAAAGIGLGWLLVEPYPRYQRGL